MPALLLSLLPMLMKFAPDLIGLAFGGSAEAVATKVGKAASDVFGTTDAAAISAQVAADPAKADAFQARLQAETDQLKADLADVQSARAATTALAQAGSTIAWGAPVVSVAVTVGFIGILSVMTLRVVPDSGVVNVLVGTLATAFGSVVNYWLGSSAGSHAKTQQLADLLHTTVSPAASLKPLSRRAA
jgi:hypothetical protein